MKNWRTCKSKDCDITTGKFKGNDKDSLCKYCQTPHKPRKLDIALTKALNKIASH